MKLSPVLLASPLLLCTALAWAASPGNPPSGDAGAVHTHDAHHGHAAATATTAIDTPAVRWTPDAPLQEGMRRLRDTVAGLEHHEKGQLEPARVQALASEVDAAVEFLFSNCKLDTDPDVALHGLLARLMAGAQALHDDPADISVVASMRAAVQDYPRLFDDPGFLDTAPAHHAH